MKHILAKIKDKLKGSVKAWSTKKQAKAVKEGKAKRQIPVEQKVPIEVAVGESKFYAAPKAEERRYSTMPTELPFGYGQDRIVLQVRDPWWIHAYWEITESTWEKLRREFPSVVQGASRIVLRVYDVSFIIFKGNNAHRFFDIQITPDAKNWYIDTQGPGRSWCVDLGLLLEGGRFITIVRSNTVSTPLAGPSWITDEEWMIPEELFSRLYGMGVGIGSSPINLKVAWQERLKREFGSGALFSVSSPVRKQRPKSFWLVVNTELIVYGQTESDAKLTVAGKPVKLRPDGSFSLRLLLPDGKQIIPVTATSSDGEQVRGITPIVTKKTK